MQSSQPANKKSVLEDQQDFSTHLFLGEVAHVDSAIDHNTMESRPNQKVYGEDFCTRSGQAQNIHRSKNGHDNVNIIASIC